MPRYPQAILVSCEVPWDEREQLLESVFREEIRETLKAGFGHVYIFGTAGEGYAVDLPRFQRVAEIFWEETKGKAVSAMVGAIALSTALSLERIKIAYDLGFRCFQIALPCWGALNDNEVMKFFRDVCGAYPDASFLHYNLPRAKRILNGADYKKLVAAVPNLVGTKNTGGGHGRAEDLMKNSPELQHFFGEDNFPYGCFYGECSLLASLAAVAPDATKRLFEAGRKMEVERVFRLRHFFHELLQGLLKELLVLDRIDGAYDKIWIRLSGLETMPLRLLSPYEGFTEAQYLVVKERYFGKFNRGRFTE
jgi:dihydrodipicolinate synthase/N-acetylneuraminate lyase